MAEDFTNAAIIIPLRAPGRVAVCTRLPGIRLAGWTATPGGSIDPGESPPEAAARELSEEGGLEVDQGRLVYVGRHTALGPDGEPAGGYFFLLWLEPGEALVATEPDKHTPWEEVPLAQAASMRLLPPLADLIRLLAAGAASVEAA